MITISTINTATNMIPSVEPASSSACDSAVIVLDCEAGVAVASWLDGRERLRARLLTNRAIPSKTQNAIRMVCEVIFILFGWYRNKLKL